MAGCRDGRRLTAAAVGRSGGVGGDVPPARDDAGARRHGRAARADGLSANHSTLPPPPLPSSVAVSRSHRAGGRAARVWGGGGLRGRWGVSKAATLRPAPCAVPALRPWGVGRRARLARALTRRAASTRRPRAAERRAAPVAARRPAGPARARARAPLRGSSGGGGPSRRAAAAAAASRGRSDSPPRSPRGPAHSARRPPFSRLCWYRPLSVVVGLAG